MKLLYNQTIKELSDGFSLHPRQLSSAISTSCVTSRSKRQHVFFNRPEDADKVLQGVEIRQFSCHQSETPDAILITTEEAADTVLRALDNVGIGFNPRL